MCVCVSLCIYTETVYLKIFKKLGTLSASVDQIWGWGGRVICIHITFICIFVPFRFCNITRYLLKKNQ